MRWCRVPYHSYLVGSTRPLCSPATLHASLRSVCPLCTHSVRLPRMRHMCACAHTAAVRVVSQAMQESAPWTSSANAKASEVASSTCAPSCPSASRTAASDPRASDAERDETYLHTAVIALLVHTLPSSSSSNHHSRSRYVGMNEAWQRLQAHARRTLSSHNRVQQFVQQLTLDALTNMVRCHIGDDDTCTDAGREELCKTESVSVFRRPPRAQEPKTRRNGPPRLWLQRLCLPNGNKSKMYYVARRVEGEECAPDGLPWAGATPGTATAGMGMRQVTTDGHHRHHKHRSSRGDEVHDNAQDDGQGDSSEVTPGDASTSTSDCTSSSSFTRCVALAPCCAAVSRSTAPSKVTLADASAWRSPEAVPTPADVYAILRYIPVNWGNMGLLQIPPEVRRRHIRIASILMWFRRQPHFFELRNMNGTVEIRRSVVLHPAAHRLTLPAATAQLEQAIRTGEANRLVLLDCHGQPCVESSPTNHSSHDGSNSNTTMHGNSNATDSVSFSNVAQYVLRFLTRTCPGYFVPLGIVLQRYIKKNLTLETLAEFAAQHPDRFETLRLRYSDDLWVRQRTGADSARWGKGFVADVERYPGDVAALVIVCQHVCTLWDRPEYVYARLSAQEKRIVHSLDYMMAVLRRHPSVFRLGRVFVCRVDLSDPVCQSSAEPAEGDCLSCSYNTPINPYLSPEEVVKVFYHVAPPQASCTVAFFVGCASPAMQGALPPRVITLIQLFPAWFACQEVTPGVFTVRKLASKHTTIAPATARANAPGVTGQTNHHSSCLAPSEGEQENDAGSVCAAECEEDMLAGEEFTREDALAAMKELIPADGVDVAHLLLWASLALQRAAVMYYGSVVRMVELEKDHFRVAENERAKTVYLRDTMAVTPPVQHSVGQK